MLRIILRRAISKKIAVFALGLWSVLLLLRQWQPRSPVEPTFDRSVTAFDGADNKRSLQSAVVDKDDGPVRSSAASATVDANRNAVFNWSHYRPPVQSGVAQMGRVFDVKETYLARSNRYDRFVDLNAKGSAEKFVLATAASSPFYRYALEAIATVQRHLPNRTVLFYDLSSQRQNSEKEDTVAEKISNLCGIQYRRFNFDVYPFHVRTLRNYAWKPIIIAEILSEFPGVFWIDASIRFSSGNLSAIVSKAASNGGMVSLRSTGHSNYAVTHPDMYAYLPTSMSGMIKTDQHEANCLLLFKTRTAFENVLWWWRMCALDPRCIAATDRLSCRNPYRSRNVYADCHRFDQSALNILLANHFAFDDKLYYVSQDAALVARGHTSNGGIGVCREGKATTFENISEYL